MPAGGSSAATGASPNRRTRPRRTATNGTYGAPSEPSSRHPPHTTRGLRAQEGGDIIVLASTSVIRALIEADELDRLSITLCPELVGGGAHLFNDATPRSSWSLTSTAATESGALCLIYDRVDA